MKESTTTDMIVASGLGHAYGQLRRCLNSAGNADFRVILPIVFPFLDEADMKAAMERRETEKVAG